MMQQLDKWNKRKQCIEKELKGNLIKRRNQKTIVIIGNHNKKENDFCIYSNETCK